jgi:hypothetical protein
MRRSKRRVTITTMLTSIQLVGHPDAAVTRVVRVVFGACAWLEEQIWPPRGREGITPARITVWTGHGEQTLARHSRRG